MKTQTELSPFEQAVDHYCAGYTVAPGCRGIECEHADGDENHQCETYFSRHQCDSCGSTLGGDRETATMIPLDYKAGDDTMIECEICVDCLVFWANGELPEVWQ